MSVEAASITRTEFPGARTQSALPMREAMAPSICQGMSLFVFFLVMIIIANVYTSTSCVEAGKDDPGRRLSTTTEYSNSF